MIFYGLLIILNACIDPIELDSQRKPTFLVINGQITDRIGPYSVTINQSGNEVSELTYVNDAMVNIISSDGQFTQLSHVGPGLYQTDPQDLIGRIGNTYTVQVIMENGAIYRSEPEKLLPVTPILNVDFDFVREPILNEVENVSEQKRVKIKLDTHVPDNLENVFFKWNVIGEYEFKEEEALTDIFRETGVGTELFTCYVADIIRGGDVSVFDGTDNAGTRLLQQEIKSIDVNYKFSFNYCAHIEQQSLTSGAYQFWSAVNLAKNRSGTLFETIPGRITGNIKNINNPEEEVLGYFYASSVVNRRLFIPPDSVSRPVSPCLVIDPAFRSSCMNCLELENSTRAIPPYWPRD